MNMNASAHTTLLPGGERPQVSVLNFLRYNVVGGESALYGVESPSYYLRNGFNNLQLLLPLVLLLPILSHMLMGDASPARRGQGALLLASIAPVYVWLGAITALPHKEERFLYVVYPLVSALECVFVYGAGREGPGAAGVL
jgi:alpha-1,2-mannosyltransferase